jgi:flavin reductase (DIM6/NTAB) family NADH-FMN oxidoreductase RutF
MIEASVALPSARVPVQKLFATTVALITSQSPGRAANVMACEWTMNVCWEPLRIMSIVEQGDLTHELIAASGEFGVNMCAADQASLAHLAGSVSGRRVAKLSLPDVAARTYPGTRIGAPMIRGCVLNVECVVERTIEFDDYTGFIGRAVAVQTNEEALPLLYHRGAYWRLGEAIAKPTPRPAADPRPALGEEGIR